MIGRTLKPGATVRANKGYDTEDFVRRMKHLGVKAHVARKTTSSAVDGQTARGQHYTLSMRCRKRIKEAFGWIKTVGGLRKTRHIGLKKLAGQVLFTFASYNLTRLMNLMQARTATLRALPS